MDERLEETACLICGAERAFRPFHSQDAVVVGVAHRHTLVRCECGFVFARPRLKPQVFQDYYKGYFDDPSGYAHERSTEHALVARRILERFRAHGLAEGARLVDVGCGTGNFLVASKAQGFSVVGLDPSARAVAFTRSRGVEAVEGWLDGELPFADGSFDAVVLIQTLEHFPAPLRALERARRLVRPGGLAAVEVPNVENVFTTWARRLGRKDGTDTLIPGDHYSYFTTRTLAAALDRTGWRTLETNAGFHDGILGTRFPRVVAKPVARLSRSLRWGSSMLAIARAV